jgi:type 1 glutamine amidotransferase
MNKVIKYSLLVAVSLVVILMLSFVVLFYALKQSQPQIFADPVINRELPKFRRPITEPSILVFSKTNAFRHKEAIEAGQQLFKNLAAKNNWNLYTTENAAVFNTQQLLQVNVVVWLCATNPALTDAQQKGFKDYLYSGGSLLAIHSAGDDSHKKWPWYQQQVIKAKFIGHSLLPQFQTATINVEQTQHPAMLGLPETWQHEEEWYSFEESPRSNGVSVLATVDEDTYKPGRGIKANQLAMGKDHPVIWSHELGRGKVFYTALGHQAKTYQDPLFKMHIEQAVKWLGGFNQSAP